MDDAPAMAQLAHILPWKPKDALPARHELTEFDGAGVYI
jgi:hypothetical protein